MPLQHENFFKSHIFVPHKKRISTESGLWIIWTLTKSNQIHPWPLCWRCYGSLIWGLLLNHLLCPSCYHHPEHNIQGVSHLMVTTRPILTILEQFAQDLTRPPPWFTLSLWHLNCPSGRTALFHCISPSTPTVFPLFSWTTFVHRIVPGLTGFGVSSHLANQILLDNFSHTITGFLPDFQDFHRNLLQIWTDPCRLADSLWKYYSYCFRFRWTNKPSFRIINWSFFVASTSDVKLLMKGSYQRPR